MKMLCEIKGIDVNLPDNEGNTPLITASQGGMIRELKCQKATDHAISFRSFECRSISAG